MAKGLFTTREGWAALGKSITAGAALAAAAAAMSAEGYIPIGFLVGVPVIRGLGFIMYDPKHAPQQGQTEPRPFIDQKGETIH